MKRRDFLQSSLFAAALWPGSTLLPPAARAAIEASGDLEAIRLDGEATTLRRADIVDLARTVHGVLLLPDAPDYDEARKVWNGMIDKRPALIARCFTKADVVAAVNFARTHCLLTAVRAGGHSFSGRSTCDGGLVIDVSPMREVHIDAPRRLARVQGGTLQGALDREAGTLGVVTATGTVSHTGIAGLTLGGGFGRVGRRFGLACDNLESIEIVTAAGHALTASERENADLFWAARGGGGNFGVATSFVFRLHSMAPMVLAGSIAWPFERAREVLRAYAGFAAQAPDELNLDVVLRGRPDGTRIIAVQACWSADHAAGLCVLQPLRTFGNPTSDTIAPVSYIDLQASADVASAAGARRYVKSGFFRALEPAIDAILEAFRIAAPGTIGLSMQQAGGAIGRIATDATAFANRDIRYWVNCSTRSATPADDDARIAAVRGAWQHIEPFTAGFYVNAMSEDLHDKVDGNYGRNLARLVAIKKRYDPRNLFRLNANIRPSI